LLFSGKQRPPRGCLGCLLWTALDRAQDTHRGCLAPRRWQQPRWRQSGDTSLLRGQLLVEVHLPSLQCFPLLFNCPDGPMKHSKPWNVSTAICLPSGRLPYHTHLSVPQPTLRPPISLGYEKLRSLEQAGEEKKLAVRVRHRWQDRKKRLADESLTRWPKGLAHTVSRGQAQPEENLEAKSRYDGCRRHKTKDRASMCMWEK